ncbi:helix-turn-helix domain-containing protein [Streptomyces sp. Marseille-Q5077]|uniref:helix-turn-helix domain-containing protein n=1 Tax=Streptomyces sp. Marseille-Q5077 TaxID=3418995 RepID=UPI003CFF4B5E
MHWHAFPRDTGQPTPAPAVGTGRHARRCRRCQCVLSRYNEEEYCSGCSRRTRHQPEPVPSVPSDVWARTDVQEALFARDFGRLCQLVRVASDLRQSDMAALTGLSQAFLSMLESGARRLTNIDKIVELLAGVKTPTELTGPMLRMPSGRGEEPDERHDKHERPNGT